eukprot:COSAG02_NODE_1271_length_13526_cov_6.207865_9_plen_1183_part_00
MLTLRLATDGGADATLFSPAASPVGPPTLFATDAGLGELAPADAPGASFCSAELAPAATPGAGALVLQGLLRHGGGVVERQTGGEDAEQMRRADLTSGCRIGSPNGAEIAADEQQFLSFLAGLAATEHDASTGRAKEDIHGVAGDRVLVEQVERPGAPVDVCPSLTAIEPLPKPASTLPHRRSGRAPKPKRHQEAPGSDASALRKKAKHQQQQQQQQQPPQQQQPHQQPHQQQRKTPRIRLTSSSIDAASSVAAKRRQDGASLTTAAPKRPRLRLSSSSVQQAYDAAAAKAAATKRLGESEGCSDDEDDLPLFSIKNKEMEKKYATPEEVMSQLTVGCKVQVKVEKGSKGWPGRVIKLDTDRRRVLVHFTGWNARYDRWIRAKASRISLVAEQRDQPEQGVARKRDKPVAEATLTATPRNVSWLDAAEPAQPISLRTVRGGFLDPLACQPRKLVNDIAGLRYDLLRGSKRQQGKVGQRLLDLYQVLIEPPSPTDCSSQGGGLELLTDGIHTPTLSASAAKTVATLLLRVGAHLVGAATFRLLHSGGQAGERQDDSTLVLEILGLAVVSEQLPDTSARQTPHAAFGTRLVNGLKAIAWAEMVQLGGPRRRHAEDNGRDYAKRAAASVSRRATRSQGSRRCCIIARPSSQHAVAFWLMQQLHSGEEANAVVSYVACGRPESPSEVSSTPDSVAMLCMLQPDGSDVPKEPRSPEVDRAARRELTAAVVLQKALRRLLAARERAAIEAARKRAELERQRAAAEAARQRAAADAEEIEDTIEDIVRTIVAKAAAKKAKAKREAKAAAKAAALARAKATREANAAARKIEEAKQAAELRAWKAGLAVGTWCVEDETDRAGQLMKAPDHANGVVELLWADTQMHSQCLLDDLRAPSPTEEAAAVSTASVTQNRIAAEEAAAAAEKVRIAAEKEAQRTAIAEAAAAATRLAAEADAARLAAEAEAARLAAAIKEGVRAIILEAGESAAQMTFKGVRACLEQRLKIHAGGLDAKKFEVKAAVRQTWLDMSSHHSEVATSKEVAPALAKVEVQVETEKKLTGSEQQTEMQEQTETQRATSSGLTAAETQAGGPSAPSTSVMPIMKVKWSKNSKNVGVASNGSANDHGTWRCIKKAVLRAGAALTSDKVGRLKPGAVFKALDVRAVEGQLRVRAEMGWASVRSLTGNSLLEKQ